MNENVKSGNIALHKNNIKDMLIKANLKAVKIVDGYWRDEIRDTSKREYQDIVVYKKLN